MEGFNIIEPKSNTLVIEFFASTESKQINELFETIDRAIDQGFNKFVLVIASSGGNTYQGILAHNYFKFRSDINLITYNLSHVYSAATNLFFASKDRYCHPNSIFNIHEGKWKRENYATENELNELLKEANEINKICINIITESTNLNYKDAQEAYFKRSVYNATDCVTHKIATSIHENIDELIDGEFSTVRII